MFGFFYMLFRLVLRVEIVSYNAFLVDYVSDSTGDYAYGWRYPVQSASSVLLVAKQ
jgi:hypothetical protein